MIRIGLSVLPLAIAARVGFEAAVAATDTGALQVSDQRPNIVLVLTDDLGYGDVSHLNPGKIGHSILVCREAGAEFTWMG